jgi:hypothetical protein
VKNIFSLDNMGSRESFMKDLETRLSAGMKRAYWDMMEKDISNNDFRTTFAMVEEIRARICLLVPKRVDLHQQIAESLDIDYFKQMQSHNALTIDMVQKITNYIIDKIKELGSQSDEPWNEIWRERVNSKFIQNEPLTVILPSFFKEAMHRIEKLEYEIKMFKESEIYKLLTERNNT